MSCDFPSTINMLETHINPEIWHFRRGTHPGPQWRIKTLLPKATVHPTGINLEKEWRQLANRHPAAILITDTAIDWTNSDIYGFATIWVTIINDISHTNWQNLKLISNSNGIEQSRKLLIKSIDAYELPSELNELVNFLINGLSSNDSKLKKLQLKVIDGGLCS